MGIKIIILILLQKYYTGIWFVSLNLKKPIVAILMF